MPKVILNDPMANHLNLGAVFDIVAFLARGFRADDRIWRQVVDLTARFIGGEDVV